ncbi:MAG: radical SAM protein [Phycisphaeraceae bacterium]
MHRETNSFGKSGLCPPRRRCFYWAWYGLRALWRHIRIGRGVTRLLGPQYRRSRTLIEIDITYACNLRCMNCNRSVRQAPEPLHLPLTTIREFVDESLASSKWWQRIRVLGGEPTLHPQFFEILAELERYRAVFPSCLIEVATNGYGEAVTSRLAQLPSHIWIDNSGKHSPLQPSFGPFNDAPADDPRYRPADYTNGCAIMHDCGMGLTPQGYFPCAVAGGIARITGSQLNRPSLPEDGDAMLDILAASCRLCGRFRDGHYLPRNLRPALAGEVMSPSWVRLYTEWWRTHRPGQALPPSLIGRGGPDPADR